MIISDKLRIVIAAGKSHPIETIKRDISLGFDKVICVATTECVLHLITQKLNGIELERKNDVVVTIGSAYVPYFKNY